MTVGALFFGGNSAEDETRTYDSDEERSAGRVGGSSARRGKSGVSVLARGRRSETAAGENNSFSFRNGGKAGIGERRSRARARVGGTRFGSMMLASPFTGARTDGSWSLFS